MMKSWVAPKSQTHACNCIGPQSGQPVCPCSMRGVVIIEGRYVRLTDLGPAQVASQAFSKEYSEFNRLMGEDKGSV